MQRTLTMSRDVMSLMLPLGRSVPCRLVATVILALVTGAAMAGPMAQGDGGGQTAAPASACVAG